MKMKIIRNAARCKLCGDVIESTYQHDYVMCSCGACAVDGGHAYLRRSAKDFSLLEDLSVVEQEEEELSDKLF